MVQCLRFDDTTLALDFGLKPIRKAGADLIEFLGKHQDVNQPLTSKALPEPPQVQPAFKRLGIITTTFQDSCGFVSERWGIVE